MPLQAQGNDHGGENLRKSFLRFSKSGRSWIKAESDLARAELASDSKRAAFIFLLAVLSIAAVLSGTMLLMLFIVALLAPFVGGLANSAGILAFVLIFLAIGAAWWAWKLIHAELGLVSVVKRWMHVANRNMEAET